VVTAEAEPADQFGAENCSLFSKFFHRIDGEHPGTRFWLQLWLCFGCNWEQVFLRKSQPIFLLLS
jgi:hypothetical protein